jgi:addiction module HigA family antidote
MIKSFKHIGEYSSNLMTETPTSSTTTITTKGEIMGKMKRKPTHPGEILKADYLVPLKISVTEMALKLGISRKTLSKIVNEKGSVTPDMALRLSRAFDTTPDLWLNLQKTVDLWNAEHASSDWKQVQPLPSQMLHPEL